jgi:redox-sensitive bicupin YhaK (pirin superfamily)
MAVSAAKSTAPTRAVVRRTRGRPHGSITRLMSPSDFGQILKPFVFLDLFDNHGQPTPGFGLHPHSGIATVTWLAEGSAEYEDPSGERGVLHAGGLEWMLAGGGMWHGGGGGVPGRTRGFQLWIALPPEVELAPAASRYLSPDEVPADGPARILLGSHGSARSPIATPSPVNYLAVTLNKGERWHYQPPTGHTVLWTAIAAGKVAVPDELAEGELAAFAPGNGAVEFTALGDAEFLVGSAVPHAHDLVTGYYSVHTSPEALRKGEANIVAIQDRLVAEGRL